MPRLGAGSVALLIAALGPSSAWGQEPAPAEDPVQACLDSHERSQVLRLESKLVEASATLRTCAQPTCPAPIRADCTRWLNEVRYAIPTVVLMARSDAGDETEVAVYANNRQIAERLDGKPLQLDPGVYEFRFEHEGTKPTTLRVVLREGEKNRALLAELHGEPKPEETAPPPPPPPRLTVEAEPETYRPVPVLTWILGGLAVGAGGAAVYFGLDARSSYADADASCAPLCSTSQLDEIRTKALIADVSTGVAVASAALAVFFYLSEPEQPTEQPAPRAANLRPEVSIASTPGGLSLDVRGRF